ncbi:MAG: polysaccharide deacetylase family protein [Candidatus Sumerlaeia bacterium]|nr:polysaccharide deacetylase family protein [Candidatus Sumerlaeia bacterium]
MTFRILMTVSMAGLVLGCATREQPQPVAPEKTPGQLLADMPVTRSAEDFTWVHDAIVRGPRDEKKIALIFTGGSYGDGTSVILDILDERDIVGAFYFTGDFLADPDNRADIERMIDTGHIVGAHGHAHLLYAAWEDRNKTLVTEEEFATDLRQNISDLMDFGLSREEVIWWIPPYEWYNSEITQWSLEEGMRIFNFSPGTLSHADYTTADMPNYRDNETIFRSVIDFEEREADGLNGFFLFTHVGAHPGRPDRFYDRLPELLDTLSDKGYTYISAHEMLEGAPLLPN